MKIKKVVLRISNILIFAIGVIVMFINFAFAIDLNDYYPLNQGNSWTYIVRDGGKSPEKLVEIKGKEIIDGVETIRMVLGKDKYSYIAIDSEGVKCYKTLDESDYEISTPPKIILPNLEIGQRSEYVYVVESGEYSKEGEKIQPAEITKIKDQILLESTMKDLEVPAGKFSNCLKFLILTEWRDSNGNYGRENYDVWLASGVGKIKEICSSTKYDQEAKEEKTSVKIEELVSAVVNDKRIGQ